MDETYLQHDIGEDEKFCPHDGTALERFGEETSERYGYRRPKIWVERHIRHRYGCPTCRSGEAIKIAPVPAQLLPKTNAGASLLAHLIANKFVDGIPIYRTCGQLQRLGMDLSPGTAGTWINAATPREVLAFSGAYAYRRQLSGSESEPNRRRLFAILRTLSASNRTGRQ
jgi:transposase